MKKLSCLWFDQESLIFRLLSFYRCKKVTRDWRVTRWINRLLTLFISSMALVFAFFIPTLVQAQQMCDDPNQQQTEACLAEAAVTPPQRAVADSILPGTLVIIDGKTDSPGACPNLARAGAGLNPAQMDLFARCSEMIANSTQSNTIGGARNALGETSVDKLASEGTSFVETSNQNIGSRIAALRGSATGISLGIFSLNVNGKTFTKPDQELAFNNIGDGIRQSYNSPYRPTVNNDNRQTLNDSQTAGLFPALALTSQATNSQEQRNDVESAFSRLGIFLNGDFTFGDKDQTSREAGFDFNIFAITAGVDYRFTDDLFLGLALSYRYNDIDLDSNGGSLDSNGISGSVYGSYYILDKFYIDGIISLGWVDFDTKRNINYSINGSELAPGELPDSLIAVPTDEVFSINQTATGDTDSIVFSFSVGTGYQFDYKGFLFGPYGRLNFTRADIDGYNESINQSGECLANGDQSGCGKGLALRFNSQDVTSLTTALGGQASYAISTPVGVIQPTALFGWIHEYENDARTISAFFVNDPTPGPQSEINLLTDNPDRNYFELGLGVSGAFARGISAFVYWETLLGLRDVTSNSFVVGLRGEF
ncbi:autotransporter outer membrane beta-barrel domain-containing protein [Desulfobacterota bacterium AH_259_B03_O07]|nr:autotransporter outer membrane beta-barrel domain-containing protein [Desulfobacterota bacterium AH_259_B03_O07]